MSRRVGVSNKKPFSTLLFFFCVTGPYPHTARSCRVEWEKAAPNKDSFLFFYFFFSLRHTPEPMKPGKRRVESVSSSWLWFTLKWALSEMKVSMDGYSILVE